MLIAAALAASVAAAGAADSASLAVPASEGRTVRLNAGEMFRLAEIAAAKGDQATAEAIYRALAQNPDADVRAEARFRQAKQLMKEKRYEEAAVLLRRILDDKPDAAAVRIELARLLELLGDPDAALRELRTAQASGLPPAVARMVDRYSQAVRDARPLGASIEVAIAPDSNINHSTRSDTLGTVLGDFEIDPESKGTSGLGLSLRGQAYRRFPLGKGEQQLLTRASAYGDLYGKSRFNDIAVDFALGPELRFGSNRLNIELGATNRWFGQEPFIRSARLGAIWTRPVGTRMQLRLAGTASLIDNRFNPLQDGKDYSGQLQLERALNSTTGLGLTLGLNREDLRDPGYSTTGWRASLIGWKDIGRATFSATGEIGHLDADERLLLFPDKRRDHYSRVTLAATLRQLTFKGFAPVARLTVERNQSTIEFYDYKRTRAELAIVRAF